MAKHPHKLMLVNDRTWRCMLDGCAFFVHLGLAHVIVGKRLVCWKCEDTFVVSSPLSISEPRPICPMCSSGIEAPTPMDLDKYIEEQRQKYEKEQEKDEAESETVHSADCASWSGEDCDCM